MRSMAVRPFVVPLEKPLHTHSLFLLLYLLNYLLPHSDFSSGGEAGTMWQGYCKVLSQPSPLPAYPPIVALNPEVTGGDVTKSPSIASSSETTENDAGMLSPAWC